MHKSLLPEPAYRRLSDLQSGVDDYYTPAQMRQMWIDTLEEAAQICHCIGMQRVASTMECETAIRSLKEKKHD